MHKQKVHKGLKKRVRATRNGMIVYKAAGAGHLMSGKPGTRKQRLRRRRVLQSKIAKNLLILLGEG